MFTSCVYCNLTLFQIAMNSEFRILTLYYSYVNIELQICRKASKYVCIPRIVSFTDYISLVELSSTYFSVAITRNKPLIKSALLIRVSCGVCARFLPSVSFVCWPATVVTVGGNANGVRCVFPFIFAGQTYSSCTTRDADRPWCSTTANFTKDGSWGYCPVKSKGTSSGDTSRLSHKVRQVEILPG